MSNLAINFPRDTFLGFDSLFNTLQNFDESNARGIGYPPYNVVKRDDGHFLIEIAVAGFRKEDIDLTLEKGVLTISGHKQGHTDTRDYTHRGISQRAFERSFTLAKTINVVGADIVDGLLIVILENDVPEEDKPQTINLGDLPKHAKKLLLG